MTTNYREIQRLESLGLNKTDIASAAQCARNTVSTTLARAKAFGVGALCATRVCRFSEEQLGQMLSTEFSAMMLLVKSGKPIRLEAAHGMDSVP